METSKIDEESLERLLQEANIKELVDRQPDGLDEEIGHSSASFF